MKPDSKALSTWYVEQQKELAKKYNGEVSNPDYKRELKNLQNKFHRERKKLNPKELAKPATSPKITYNDQALSGITDPLELAVIKAHLADITKPYLTIANEVGEGLSAQMVTAILGREDVKQVIKGLLWNDISLAVEVAIRDGVSRKDPTWAKIALEWGFVKGKGEAECAGCHNKPLELGAAVKESLKLIGDILADINASEHLTALREIAEATSKRWK